MIETRIPRYNRLHLTPTRKVLAVGATLLATLTSCGLPRAEYDASTKKFEVCDTGTPLSQKDGDKPLEDAQDLIDRATEHVKNLHSRTMNAGGEIEFSQPLDQRIDERTPTYGFTATEEQLVLQLGQSKDATVDKVTFPIADGEPEAITLGALACTDAAIFPKQVFRYLETGVEATAALEPTPR